MIIVTWNALHHLKNFLPSVTRSDYEDFEIIIADNASDDGTVEWIRSVCPECSIVTYPANYGYCRGNNRAVDHARGELLVFLNNDVEVTSGWLQEINRMFDDPETGAVQPKMLSWREKKRFEYAGAAGGYLDTMAYPFCRGRVFDTIERDEGQYDDPATLFWASGAALAIRKDLFIDAGRFDDDFEFHMEEIDLCWRLLNRGHKIRFCPNSIVYHLGGGSLPMRSSRKTLFNFRNSLQMIWKNASSSWLRKYFFLRLCMDGVAGIYSLLKGNPSDTLAIFKAHAQFYIMWPAVHRKRGELQKKRTVEGEPDEMAKTVLITDYFIRNRKTYLEITGR